jgi:hypothetical protein
MKINICESNVNITAVYLIIHAYIHAYEYIDASHTQVWMETYMYFVSS